MRPHRFTISDAWRARLALVVVAVAAVLDRDGCLVANQAAVFGFVIEALLTAGQAIESAAAYITVHLEAVVLWLVSQFSWLSGHVAKIFSSTGAMFAKVWDGARVVYEDVLKPVALELKALYERAREWIQKYVKPVYDFLKDVRDRVLAFYRAYIRPFLDAIDIARGALRVLGDLGIAWAKALDQKLGQVESVITENFLWILGQLNRMIDVVNSVVTFDLLFQRFPFLSTLKRDITFVNAAIVQAMLDSRIAANRGLGNSEKLPRKPNDQYVVDLEQFYRDASGPYADAIPSATTAWLQAARVESTSAEAV